MMLQGLVAFKATEEWAPPSFSPGKSRKGNHATLPVPPGQKGRIHYWLQVETQWSTGPLCFKDENVTDFSLIP